MDSSIGHNKTYPQDIYFKSSEEEFCAEIVGRDVRINSSAGSHNHGSSKVKLTDIVDFNWGLRLCAGQLIAIHSSGNYIAYGLKTKDVGMVRILNTTTNQKSLIKGVKGLIYDISFAFCSSQIILGFVDEDGTLFVYDIQEENQRFKHTLLLQIVHPIAVGNPHNHFRIMWCPYVATFGEDPTSSDELSKLLVLLNGKTAEVWDVWEVQEKYGEGPLLPTDSYEGYVNLDCHTQNIVDASFSPDGTAIATASLDGYVKFFQVFLKESDKPRCLHQWKPHEGKALSSLLFLDNVNNYGTDCKFWKFAVTGANHNAEIKIWSCETWTCTQTITFQSNPNAIVPEMFFKMRLDTSAHYILMSELNNRLMYVLQITKDEERQTASAATISEFLLPASCISFCIKSASLNTVRYSTNSSLEDLYLANYEDDETATAVTTDSCHTVIDIILYLMQPKCLQECKISYKPDCSLTTYINSMYGNITTGSVDKLDETSAPELPKLNELQTSVEILIKQQQQAQQQQQQPPPQQSLTLMTPDDFHSPIVDSTTTPIVDSTSNPEILSPILKNTDVAIVDNLIDFQQATITTSSELSITTSSEAIVTTNATQQAASGGSSPSREVQEILSLNNTTYTPQEFFENLSKINQENGGSVAVVDGVSAVAGVVSAGGITAAAVAAATGSGGEKNGEVVVKTWPNIPMMDAIELEIKQEQRLKQLSDDATNMRLAMMEGMLREQGEQLVQLQQQLTDNRLSFSGELSTALAQQQQAMKQMFETYADRRATSANEQREHIDHVVTALSHSLGKDLHEHMKGVLNREMTAVVTPAVLARFDQLQHSMDADTVQKMGALDRMVKGHVDKLFQNKVVVDSLTNSIVNVLKPSMESCYRDMMGHTLIPSWEKVCSMMFQQIHTTFTKGTKEYTTSVESYMDRQWKVQDKEKDLIHQMQTVSDAMKYNIEQLSIKMYDTIQNQITCAFTHMETKLHHSLTDIIRDEITTALLSHTNTLEDTLTQVVHRSRTVTPANSLLLLPPPTPTPSTVVDPQTQLLQLQSLLNKGHVETAFQLALSASASAGDLALVLFVCERVNTQDVFGGGGIGDGSSNGGGCVLKQHVLLSLVQQLGADLARHTDIKHKYLEESLLNLDMKNPITKEHGPLVLRELLKQLNNFISNFPIHRSIKNMRMLQMVTQSILAS